MWHKLKGHGSSCLDSELTITTRKLVYVLDDTNQSWESVQKSKHSSISLRVVEGVSGCRRCQISDRLLQLSIQ